MSTPWFTDNKEVDIKLLRRLAEIDDFTLSRLDEVMRELYDVTAYNRWLWSEIIRHGMINGQIVLAEKVKLLGEYQPLEVIIPPYLYSYTRAVTAYGKTALVLALHMEDQRKFGFNYEHFSDIQPRARLLIPEDDPGHPRALEVVKGWETKGTPVYMIVDPQAYV